jgi:hypothetical protein
MLYNTNFSHSQSPEISSQAEKHVFPESSPSEAPPVETLCIYQCPHPDVRSEDSITHRNIQSQAFCGWLTYILKRQESSALSVQDLCNAFNNAHQLDSIIFALTRSKVNGLVEASSAYDKITNLNLALDVFAEQFPEVGAINASAIASNNPKAALDLAWILFYHSTLKPIKYCGLENRFGLLLWTQHTVSGFLNTPVIHDFANSFSDGIALSAIIESKLPKAIESRNMLNIQKTDNLRKAFEVAEKSFAIPKLLSPIDVTSENPDEISMIVYLTLLYENCKN